MGQSDTHVPDSSFTLLTLHCTVSTHHSALLRPKPTTATRPDPTRVAD